MQHLLAEGPAEPECEDKHQAAQVFTVRASSNAQHDSQAGSSSPGESIVSHAGTAQLSSDSSLPSRAAPPAQATAALSGSPVQTPLGLLHRLAHMLHTPQDMAAARMQASQSAPMSRSAHHGRAHASPLDSGAAEIGLWPLLDSLGDSYGSAHVAASHTPSPSRQPASLGGEAAGQMAWERSSHMREGQDPPYNQAGSPDVSQQSISALASPTETSLRPQHAASQHGAHMRPTIEGRHILFRGCDDDSGSVPEITAPPCSTKAFARPEHAAEQSWEPYGATTDARNPLFTSCSDAKGSAPNEAWEHSSVVTEGQKSLSNSAENDDEMRSPDKGEMPSSRASGGQDDQETAQMLITQLRHELQASRHEVKSRVPLQHSSLYDCAPSNVMGLV